MNRHGILVSFVCIVCAVVLVRAEKVRFDNYRFISTRVENELQQKILESLETTTDSVQFITTIDLHQDVQLIVAPHKWAYIQALFGRHGLQSVVKTKNFQKYYSEFKLPCDWM